MFSLSHSLKTTTQLNHNRLSSPSLINMEGQLNGNFGENSSSSSSNSSSAAIYPVNSSSDTSSVNMKPYKPKFHNYKKLDLSKTHVLQATSSTANSTPSTPSTPSFFSTNAGNLVSSDVRRSNKLPIILKSFLT